MARTEAQLRRSPSQRSTHTVEVAAFAMALVLVACDGKDPASPPVDAGWSGADAGGGAPAGAGEASSDCGDSCVSVGGEAGVEQEGGRGGAMAGGTLTAGAAGQRAGAGGDAGGVASDAERCEPGAIDVRPCPEECGTQTRACGEEGRWLDWGVTCTPRTIQDCLPGSPDVYRSCGKCGIELGRCLADCTYYWGECADEAGRCYPGETRSVAASCPKRNQLRRQTCSEECAWVSGDCEDQPGTNDVDLVFTVVDAVEREVPTSQPIGNDRELRSVRGADLQSTADDPTQVLHGVDATDSREPRLSKDGRWLAYLSDEGPFALPEVFALDLEAGEVRHTAIPGSATLDIAAFEWVDSRPALVAVGDFFENGRADVVMTAFDGREFTNPVRISNRPEALASGAPDPSVEPAPVAVAPSGDFVAYRVARDEGGFDLFVAGTGGDLAPIQVNVAADRCTPEADPDEETEQVLDVREVVWAEGDTIAFECSDPGESEACLCVRSIADDSVGLSAGPLAMTPPIWICSSATTDCLQARRRWEFSASGSALAYVGLDRKLCVLSVAGGDARSCAPLGPESDAASAWALQWAPRGDALIAVVALGGDTAAPDNLLWVRGSDAVESPGWTSTVVFPFSTSGLEFPEQAWAPDGSERFLVRNLLVDLAPLANGEEVTAYPFRDYAVEDYEVDGTQCVGLLEQCATVATVDHEFGRWAPDGGAIAYRECGGCQPGSRSRDWSLWTVAVDGGFVDQASRRRVYAPTDPLLRVADLRWRNRSTAEFQP